MSPYRNSKVMTVFCMTSILNNNNYFLLIKHYIKASLSTSPPQVSWLLLHAANPFINNTAKSQYWEILGKETLGDDIVT